MAFPNRCIAAGTSTVRRMNASSATAAASPMPNPATSRWPMNENVRITQIMIVAAAVMTRPVSACPVRTAAALRCVCTPFLVHSADQEHLIVRWQR